MVYCPDGSVGLLATHRTTATCSVQFGSGVPFRSYPWKTLRRATREEIVTAGLDGVGCNNP